MKLVFESEELEKYDLMDMIHCIKDTNVLSELAKHESDLVRERVASNHHTSTETLSELAEDYCWYVRDEVAKNKNTNIEALRLLSLDDSYVVLNSLSDNPNVGNDIEIWENLAVGNSDYANKKAKKMLGVCEKTTMFILMCYRNHEACDNLEGDCFGIYKYLEDAQKECDKYTLKEKGVGLGCDWNVIYYTYEDEDGAYYRIEEREVM